MGIQSKYLLQPNRSNKIVCKVCGKDFPLWCGRSGAIGWDLLKNHIQDEHPDYWDKIEHPDNEEED